MALSEKIGLFIYVGCVEKSKVHLLDVILVQYIGLKVKQLCNGFPILFLLNLIKSYENR